MLASFLYSLLSFCGTTTTATAFAFRHTTSAMSIIEGSLLSVQPNTNMNPHDVIASVAAISGASHHHARRNRLLMMSNNNDNIDNLPSQEEIVQQKSEAYRALSSFHETSSSTASSSSSSSKNSQVESLMSGLETIGMSPAELAEEESKPLYWKCANGALTFRVPMDPAAGLKHGTISEPYTAKVRFETIMGDLNAGSSEGRRSRGIRLVESIHFDDGDGNGGGDDTTAAVLPFVRSLSLGDNVDVDAVDGSYSLDDSIASEHNIDDVTVGEESSSSPPLPLLPPSLLANAVDPTSVKFVVEHALAVSETERCRCFLLYGNVDDGRDIIGKGDENEEEEEEDAAAEEEEDNDFAIVAAIRARRESARSGYTATKERSYRLLGVVLAEETKVMAETDKDNATEREKEEEEDYASEFISQMIEQSPSPTSPLDLLEVDQSPITSSSPPDDNDKVDRLMRSLEKHNKQVMESATSSSSSSSGDMSNTNAEMERHPLGMFGLTSGAWLGDTFVREAIPSAIQAARKPKGKGFGKERKSIKDIGEDDDGGDNIIEGRDRFATWSMGVQKVALRFDWDYRSSVSQTYTYGRVMGTATSLSSMANIRSDGIVVVNSARKRKREERRVVWDMDNGLYVAGLVGASYFRAPRYLTFSQAGGGGGLRDAYLTEFMVFYRPAKGEGSTSESSITALGLGSVDDGADEEETTPQYYCSRTARLYSAMDGSLMQGSTAFFSLEQAPSEQ